MRKFHQKSCFKRFTLYHPKVLLNQRSFSCPLIIFRKAMAKSWLEKGLNTRSCNIAIANTNFRKKSQMRPTD